ncbi:hypothetical protein PCANC_14207 [Puccinia coronata f. sp. avenae]|uniref:Uncharacterized protein n=1 Tax=Puccinia coronata f. sp. avenae TaxID=200324 RepID=A0A2N5SYQ4_9BASI|nr:hypothetical protein PCANC_14207 [Puccinia coronata f. sp. avenae]
MSKSWESATQTGMGLRPAQGRPSLGRLETIPEDHPDVDTQFALAQDRLKELEQRIPKPIQHVQDDGKGMSLHDRLALRLRDNAGKLRSLQEEISVASRIQQPREDTLELSQRLKTILDDIPYHSDYYYEGIGSDSISAENLALRKQGRQLESQVFQTLDFMQERHLISHNSLNELISDYGVRERLAAHLIMNYGSRGGEIPKDLYQLGASKTLQAQVADPPVIEPWTTRGPGTNLGRLSSAYMNLVT